jgi:hypothetical protein
MGAKRPAPEAVHSRFTVCFVYFLFVLPFVLLLSSVADASNTWSVIFTAPFPQMYYKGNVSGH